MSDRATTGIGSELIEASSRRSLLGAGLGALAGFVAAALGRPAPVHAANGDPVILGSASNAATTGTKITNSTASVDAFRVDASGSGATALIGSALGSNGTGVSADGGSYGVYGVSQSGVGAQGVSASGAGVSGVTLNSGGPGVLGQSSGYGTGVFGFSSGSGGIVPASQANTGVYGRADQAGSTGVWGDSNAADGTGVQGHSRVGVFGTSTTDGWMGIWGRHFGAGYGVAGDSVSLIGVSGTSNAPDHPAVLARSQGDSTGLLGLSGDTNTAVPAARAKTGVFGKATQDASSRGVVGASTTGTGVRGEATSGAAVLGAASDKAGYAIRGSGRVRFDKVSGVATIPASATTVVVTPGTDVTTESFVLLTAKTNIGTRSLSFSTDTSGDTLTIRMSSSRSTSTSVAWLLLN